MLLVAARDRNGLQVGRPCGCRRLGGRCSRAAQHGTSAVLGEAIGVMWSAADPTWLFAARRECGMAVRAAQLHGSGGHESPNVTAVKAAV